MKILLGIDYGTGGCKVTALGEGRQSVVSRIQGMLQP